MSPLVVHHEKLFGYKQYIMIDGVGGNPPGVHANNGRLSFRFS